ncbi:MAG TPA: efflux RND transporter permease subunit [Vicinamibacterales bacterium]|nr:efflux RND transporter permease subunit [Vicinamibacterales bacterium]
MSLATLLDRYGRAIVTVTIVLAAAGLLTAFTLPSDIYPPLVFPRVVVIGHSGTMPARSMMLVVTRPIEQALLEVPGVRRVRSTTFRGATEISAQFDPATDMILALQQAQGKIAEIRGSLPPDLDLAIERLTPAAFPFLSVNLTGGGLSSADLYDYAFYVMRPALSRVPGVGNVEVLASDTREIEVIADPARLTASGLTIGDVADALQAANTLQPVGRYDAGGLQHLVLASGMWKSVRDIPETPLLVKGGATIRVSDVATVQQGAPDRTTLVTGDGTVAANISVSQQVGSNILDVRAGVETALADLARTLPAGLTLSKTYDLAEFVSTAIANVRDAILIGSVLAVIVLLAFLRDWRLTLVASITLPLTVMTTFLVMRWLGETINVMSMGGLAVAIGLVIDDAVVVVENIYRHLDKGQAPAQAVQSGMTELIAPVVGSTLTTVVVFVPLGMLSGVIGQFFRALSITLAAAVLISLVQALTLIPLLAGWAANRRATQSGTAMHGHKTGGLERVYSRTLDSTMRRPILGIVVALLLAAAGVLLFMRLGSGFLPAADEGGFVIDYNAPPGSALSEIDAVVRRMEDLLKQTPEIAAFTRRTGSELGLFATQQTKGDILVRLKPASTRKAAEDVITGLRDQLEEAAPGFEIEFVQLLQDMLGDLEGAPTPIEVKVFGDDPDTLATISEQVERELEKIAGVVDLVGVQRGNPETTWDIDPTAIGRLGLNVTQVSEQLSDAWLGDVRTELRLPDRTIPVRVRYPDRYRMDPQRMAETPVRAQDGRSIPLGSVAHATSTEGELVLDRENLRQMAMVSAHLEGRDLGSAVDEVRTKLARVTLPVGYTTEIGGQYASQRQAFRELLTVFAIAAALVFIILVVQFGRFLPAGLILLAAPLSLGGAFALLLITGTDLNVSSAMGLILLVGLVVKNGIVLLDYVHRLHHEGTPFTDALEIAGRVRLRPILMTTLCTLFGLLPLAMGLGAGAELQRPLALAVIGGLTLSTFVTLYLVPLAYRALTRASSSEVKR